MAVEAEGPVFCDMLGSGHSIRTPEMAIIIDINRRSRNTNFVVKKVEQGPGHLN